jgi:ketosteroid isomerase-like protein
MLTLRAARSVFVHNRSLPSMGTTNTISFGLRVRDPGGLDDGRPAHPAFRRLPPHIWRRAAAATAAGASPVANHVDGKLTVRRVTVAGDYATRQAEWDETWTANDGATAFHQVGRCFLAWRKINGEWKVVSEFIQYVVSPTDIAVAVK